MFAMDAARAAAHEHSRVNAQLNGAWAQGADAGDAQAQYHPSLNSLMGLANSCVERQDERKTEDFDEESRRETEQAMILHPWQRDFMERILPIEWCHARYPKVYANALP